jgi:peptidoglycan/xylan/chitin deacetylase (PgdA/CDA1 family)
MIPRVLRGAALTGLGLAARPGLGGVRFFYGHSADANHVRQFERTLRVLRNWYEFVTLPAAVELLRERRSDGRYLCFSFDDGFRDNYQYIAPALNRFGASACFFIVSDLMSEDIELRRWILREKLHTSGDREVLDWALLRELAVAGFTIGCHTASHENLGALERAAAIDQVMRGKRDIEEHVGVPCLYFSWPYGRSEHFPAALLPELAGAFDGVFSAIRSRYAMSYDGGVINRDHFEPNWPTAHVRYFAARPVMMAAHE